MSITSVLDLGPSNHSNPNQIRKIWGFWLDFLIWEKAVIWFGFDTKCHKNQINFKSKSKSLRVISPVATRGLFRWRFSFGNCFPLLVNLSCLMFDILLLFGCFQGIKIHFTHRVSVFEPPLCVALIQNFCRYHENLFCWYN